MDWRQRAALEAVLEQCGNGARSKRALVDNFVDLLSQWGYWVVHEDERSEDELELEYQAGYRAGAGMRD